MDRLSSCYFCGAALDATLEERPVVPSALHPSTDSQKTIVLCGTCQRKLDAVLDTVLDAVEAATVDADGAGDSQSGDPLAADDDLESALGDDEDILTPVGDDAAGDAANAPDTESEHERTAADDEAESVDSTAAADDSEDEKTDDGQKEPKYTKSRGAGFRREDDGPVETGSLTGGAFSDDDDDESDAGSLTGDAFDDSNEPSDTASAGQSEATSGGRSADDSGNSSSSGGSSANTGSASGSTDSSDSDSSGNASGQRDVSMTRLENTKVMRLLENREFPVDRDEFVTVAANAYQVSRDDCDKVIDLAVEHDLLREENGQLYGGDA